jgi:ubiquinone/menaquinone biosynthesis C-methylase UbiE
MRTIFSLATLAVASGIAYGQQPAETGKTPSHETDAKTYYDLVETKLKQTYPATAMRMLQECGNVRDGICVDIGCGTGHLDVELARRSNLEIVGVDINPEMKPFFEKQVRQAGLGDRIRFVAGDAQKLPFPDDYADVIVSRGVLIFIPDLARCLTEVDRVLKPSGVAFLGGRYLHAPLENKMSSEELRRIVRQSGIPGAEVIDRRGQWVKIIGREAPQAARKPELGASMLVARCLADYGIAQGDCLLVCSGDGESTRGIQRDFLDMTGLKITALYSSAEVAGQARSRMAAAQQDGRITCRVGKIDALPFSEASFDLAVGAGPVLIWSDRQRAMRELYRVLRPGGRALVGGRYLQMPAARKVSSETLRQDARASGIPSIRILDEMGQWVEIRKDGEKKTGAVMR